MEYFSYFSSENGFGKYKTTAIDLLEKTIMMLNEFNIDYFLISGTLLGFVRHNDFIQWDDDIDIIVDASILNKSKLDKIIEKYSDIFYFTNQHNYLLKIFFKDKEIPIKHPYMEKLVINKNNDTKYFWPFIDLFIYKYSADRQHLLFFNKQWNVSSFFPKSEQYFLNLKQKVCIPHDPDYFLKNNFGPNYMNIFDSGDYSHKLEKVKDKHIITREEYEKLLSLSYNS